MAEAPQQQPSNLPPGSPPANEGKTPAAWITMGAVTVGSLICALGFVGGSTAIAVAGAVVIVLALVAGKVLQAMGFGQPRRATTGSPSPRG